MKIDIRLVLPLRDVADTCLRRSHVSCQNGSLQVLTKLFVTGDWHTSGDGGERVRRSCYRGSEDASS